MSFLKKTLYVEFKQVLYAGVNDIILLLSNRSLLVLCSLDSLKGKPIRTRLMDKCRQNISEWPDKFLCFS